MNYSFFVPLKADLHGTTLSYALTIGLQQEFHCPLFDFCSTIHCTSLNTFLKTLPSKHNTYALFTKRQVKMAVYWPGSFLVWDEVEVNKSVEQNEASIQPSWPNKLSQ